jgi:hypothetical protein
MRKATFQTPPAAYINPDMLFPVNGKTTVFDFSSQEQKTNHSIDLQR